uniref:Uncharacterized protein n=1 Tax=Solanum lycopersicum TaxID=4081 RepID=A0A3Q7EDV1_SOLLC
MKLFLARQLGNKDGRLKLRETTITFIGISATESIHSVFPLVRPRKTRNPDVDFLSFLSFAQSESEKPQSSKSPSRMSKPRPRVPKMYLRMRFRQW